MVFKISKGGVRTGNTLRGLRSERMRRYSRHACILGCTSLGRRDLSRLICDSSDNDGDDHDDGETTQMVRDILCKTNVLLSLNKRQRWRLPAMIGHMINRGDFNKGAIVSLLEKHKLKRRANCVRMVSNSKKTRNITPKQKKYFSFSLDAFGEDESNRKKRKARAEQLKSLPGNKSMSKTVKTYTSERNVPSDIPSLDSAKPEYRLEVFYPCPQSCSLTYNPKYTDVTVGEGKNGKMEVKSKVKARKKGMLKHRKRLLLKDMDELYWDAIQEDADEDSWNDYDEENDEFSEAEFEDFGNTPKPSESFVIDYGIIDMLLTQAQKTRELCINKKNTSLSPKKNAKNERCDNSEFKTHIVFVDNEEDRVNIKTQNTNIDIAAANPDKSSTQNHFSDLVYKKVVLSNSEVSPDELQRAYGARYAESSCQPRRFIIDVTEDIANLLATSRASAQEADSSSYLVLVYDGFYDEGLAVYRIAFNSMTKQVLPDSLLFAKSSISNVMNCLACHLLDQRENHRIPVVEKNFTHSVKNKTGFVNDRINVNIEIIDRNDLTEIILSDRTNGMLKGEGHSESLQSQCSTDFEEELFCDVCYESVTTSKLDSVDGTKITSCKHLLCDDCWAAHFRMSIKNGKTVMSCAAYDCDTEIGMVTLMSILHVSEICALLRRQAEEKLEKMDNARYCPYPECGRIIVVESKSEDMCVDVACACGNNICFSCFGPGHWPATCEQAEEYVDKLPDLKPAKDYGEDPSDNPAPPPVATNPKEPKVMTLEGRLCPNCLRFIDKNGGCNFVVCRCGFRWCWACIKPYHFAPCKIDPNWVYNHTRIVEVKHASANRIVSLESPEINKQPTVQKSSRHKASLYQRALRQRQESCRSGKFKTKKMMTPLISKMATAARRDVCFRREIAEALVPSADKSTHEMDLEQFDMMCHLRTFITTIIDMKKQLHHVTEYSFILLQGTPTSVATQRILKLTNDMAGFCSFVRSILEVGHRQDVKTAFRRLVSLQDWAQRALDALIVTTHAIRNSH